MNVGDMHLGPGLVTAASHSRVVGRLGDEVFRAVRDEDCGGAIGATYARTFREAGGATRNLKTWAVGEGLESMGVEA